MNKSFTQQEVNIILQGLESLGREKGLPYFGTCGMLATKVVAEFNKKETIIDKADTNSTDSSSAAGPTVS